MKLRDLDAHFLGKVNPAEKTVQRQSSINGAQGVIFQCPACAEGKERGEENGRRFVRGAHYFRVFFSNPRGAPVAPEEYDDNPRWEMSGTSLDDLTLTPSIDGTKPITDGIPSSCAFHGHVTNGTAA